MLLAVVKLIAIIIGSLSTFAGPLLPCCNIQYPYSQSCQPVQATVSKNLKKYPYKVNHLPYKLARIDAEIGRYELRAKIYVYRLLSRR